MNRRELLAVAAKALAVASCGAAGRAMAAVGEQPKSVVVIGAGIAGLTCAYALRDQDLLVLEPGGSAGGRTLSGHHAGYTYAKGTEYLGKLDGALETLADDLGLEPCEIPSPMDAQFDGQRFHYGQSGLRRYLVQNSDAATYRRFKQLVLQAFQHYDEIPSLEYNAMNRRLDGITALQWLRENGIPEVFLRKYNVSAKGLFGATLNEISALSFLPEAAFDYGDAEGDADDAEDADEPERSGAYSFKTGIIELTGALARALGERLRRGCTVTRVRPVGELFEVTYQDARAGEVTVMTRKVVLATPAPVTLAIAEQALTEERRRLLQSVRYAAYATVALFTDEPIFDRAFDLAVPDGYVFTDVYDATWVERLHDRARRLPRTGIASVYMAPASGQDRSVLEWSDEVLLRKLYVDLEKVFPGATQRVVGHDIQRFSHAYPIMSLGAYGRLLQLDRLNEGPLVLAGDYTIYPTFEAAAQSGFIAAERIRA